MRYFVPFFLLIQLLLTSTGFAQIISFEDGFEDGNFTDSPKWTGDTTDFVIYETNGNHLLRLSAPGEGTSQLQLQSEAVSGTWSFYIEQDFAPSDNNFAYIFLISDRKNLEGEVNGYALRTGESGSPKHFRLFRFDQGTPTEILAGQTEIGAGGYQVSVTRSKSNEWQLSVSEGYGSVPQPDSDVIVDSTYQFSTYFGVHPIYTSTRTDKFYFDDFQIETDFDPLAVTDVRVIAEDLIDVTFNRSVDPITVQYNDFEVDEEILPARAIITEANIIRLDFDQPLPGGTYTLTVNDVEDSYGNVIPLNTQKDFEVYNPFNISKAEWLSENKVEVAFSEDINISTVDLSDFTLINAGNPSTIEPSGNSTVLLSFAFNLTSGPHTLIVDDLQSITGWTIQPNSEITFIAFDVYEPGDIVINEFTYDPPSGSAEYVEIKNTTGKYLNLKNWKLGDDSALNTITENMLVLKPDDYLILSEDTTFLSGVFGHRNYVQMNSFRALNNSGDAIRVVTDEGITADSLSYTPSWGGRDVALERRSASTPSHYPENWGDSPSTDLGTPGVPNEVATDHTPPTFDEVAVLNAKTLQLSFSERLESDIASTVSNFSLNPECTINAVSVDYNTVTLTLEQELQSGINYQVTVERLQDIFGNVIQASTLETTYLRFSTPLPGDVVINEILHTRKSDRDPEFVELYNASSKNFDLTHWKLGDATGHTTLDAGLQLLAGGYLVLTDNPAFADTLNNVHYTAGFPSLNDAGDAIYLQSSAEVTIDSLFYRNGWANTDNGSSIERKDPKAASNDPANWQAHSGSTLYSPATVNASFREDETPPDAIFSKLLPDGYIEVRFSEFIAVTPDLRFTLGQQSLEIAFFDSTRGNIIKLYVPSSKIHKSNTAKTLSVYNLRDVRNNLMPASDIPLAYKMEQGSVVINEIMYNPINDTDDDRPNQSEYVELRNTTDHAISLEGLYLHDAPDENGEIRSLIPVSTFIKWIQPQDVALIYADETAEFKESNTAGYFDLTSRNPASLIRIDRSTLSLASEGDAVYLSDSTGTVIDSVYYDDSWHNPNLPDTRGIALERISPAGSGNIPSNWGSSTHVKGGTPYAENTLYQAPGGAPNQVGISFSPNPFSPDNDGFDDNLLINYRLNAPDYLIKVRIYDRYGRLVRKLADGQPAGFEGSLIWDGRKDDGTRNRIGIYIVVFEAFNSTQGNNQAFKETVVLARRL